MTSQQTFDPADGTVDEAKTFVEEHPEAAQEVLEAERDGKDRTTLTSWLEEAVDNTPDLDPATPGVIKSPDPTPDGGYPPPQPS